MSGNIEHLAEIFPGESEMARAMRGHDWAGSPLREPETWPDALRIPLQMLLRSRFEMWIGWGPDLTFFYNDAYIRTLGIKHPTMLGQPFREVWSEIHDDVADQLARVREGEATWNKAFLLLLERSGYPEETYHSFSYSPLYEGDGSVGGMLCVVTDDTVHVIAERRLEMLRRLGTALMGAADIPAIVDAARASFSANTRDFPFAVLRLHDEEGGVEAHYVTEPSLIDGMSVSLQEATGPAATIIPLDQGIAWPKGDWDLPPREAITIAIPGPAGQAPAGTLVLGLNPYRPDDPELLNIVPLIAGQISGALANIAMLQSERRRADRIWAVSRDLMVVVDGTGRLQSVSPAWPHMLGHSVNEVIGHHFSEFMHPDDVAAGMAVFTGGAADQTPTSYEGRLFTKDGEVCWIEWHTSFAGGLIYAYGRDVTERREAEAALNASQEQFRHLVQSVTDYAIFMLDLEGHVTSWNEGARRIKGYEPEEIIGEHFSRFYTPEDCAEGLPALALDTVRREGRFISEGWRVRKSGERFRASVVIDTVRDDAGMPMGFAKVTRDITEREATQRELERAREALFQSQKMEAIGQLTGGIAHDFNNLLMAVLSSLDLLRRRIPDDAITQRLLDNAVQGAERGATLTQRMLAFARRQDLKVGKVDVSQLLSGMGDLVQRSIGPEWPISANLPFGLPRVRADANQLEMALLNLIVNARDAVPSGGPIIVSATREDVINGRAVKLAPGRYVRLVVADQGIGMDEETLKHATEPFFTTKGVGKGTGLGLPMVHGMAHQIGGAFELLSAPGQGTRAVLWLPVAEADADQPEPVTQEDAPPDVPSLTVLVVDDDPLILMNTVAMIEDLGHRVIEASSGADALAEFSAREDIDIIITDQAMPGMTGTDLIAAMDAIQPGRPVIVASGYGEGIDALGRSVIRLSKPFNQIRLARAIAEAIEKAPENTAS